MHHRNPEVIALAHLVERTPGSVAFKLANFASFDPTLRARGIKGAANAGRLDQKVWNEFYSNWTELAFESELRLANKKQTAVEELIEESELLQFPVGRTKEQLVKVRINQAFFRKAVISAYNGTCCITGLKQNELLVAGHIRPWGVDEANRINPSNGIAINYLHDRAFENGLITITPDFHIRVSPILLKQQDDTVKKYFHKYDGSLMHLPSRFLPDPQFLKYHNDERFRA
ncbi:HNH endonuclease [Flaviaesturariibacter amylovorans]|uniref:HNH endonuclease n=2 Tax=Flaviaesturariibacter amylovorans TaxID=1084520 RepID=A0ABP8HI88_9BACT